MFDTADIFANDYVRYFKKVTRILTSTISLTMMTRVYDAWRHRSAYVTRITLFIYQITINNHSHSMIKLRKRIIFYLEMK